MTRQEAGPELGISAKYMPMEMHASNRFNMQAGAEQADNRRANHFHRRHVSTLAPGQSAAEGQFDWAAQ